MNRVCAVARQCEAECKVTAKMRFCPAAFHWRCFGTNTLFRLSLVTVMPIMLLSYLAFQTSIATLCCSVLTNVRVHRYNRRRII